MGGGSLPRWACSSRCAFTCGSSQCRVSTGSRTCAQHGKAGRWQGGVSCACVQHHCLQPCHGLCTASGSDCSAALAVMHAANSALHAHRDARCSSYAGAVAAPLVAATAAVARQDSSACEPIVCARSCAHLSRQLCVEHVLVVPHRQLVIL
jgi:hypothetical protein